MNAEEFIISRLTKQAREEIRKVGITCPSSLHFKIEFDVKFEMERISSENSFNEECSVKHIFVPGNFSIEDNVQKTSTPEVEPTATPLFKLDSDQTNVFLDVQQWAEPKSMPESQPMSVPMVNDPNNNFSNIKQCVGSYVTRMSHSNSYVVIQPIYIKAIVPSGHVIFVKKRGELVSEGIMMREWNDNKWIIVPENRVDQQFAVPDEMKINDTETKNQYGMEYWKTYEIHNLIGFSVIKNIPYVDRSYLWEEEPLFIYNGNREKAIYLQKGKKGEYEYPLNRDVSWILIPDRFYFSPSVQN